MNNSLVLAADPSRLASREEGATGELQVLSVFALGMGPLVNAFLLVELAALVVPSWRPLRHGGPTGRRALGRATAYLAVVLAAVQAYFIASYLQALSDGGAELFAGGLKSRLLVVLTLVGGTMILAWLIAGICQRGLGNGFAVLLLLGCVSSVQWRDIAPTANAFERLLRESFTAAST
jgi:preprotein translocase subunit SecY